MAALEIPTLMGFNSKVFDLGHFQQMTPSGDVGFIQTINRSTPAWMAEYSTPGLSGDRYNETRAFLDLLEGSMNTFLGFDPRRPMPYAYRTQPLFANVWGAPNVVAQDYANSFLDFNNFLPGAHITKGDYISVKVGNIWYLFRSTATLSAGGDGTARIYVKPRPNIVNLVSTPIRYKKACIEMKQIGDVDETDSVDDLPMFKFRAAQFTNRAS